MADTFEGLDAVVEHTPITASWAVQVPTWKRHSLLITSTWGTKRADAITLFDKSLNQQQHQVYDTDADGRRVFNPEETLLAQEKQQALSDRFAAWIWEDPERRARLAARYNQLFNSIVLPVWDGSHQTFPGLSPTFGPHPHQIDAVWRAVQEPSVLLGHTVGAGKTATMVMSVMEMRRLGLVRKPALVVPNHMLDQVTREFLQLYPHANVLMATGEETRPDRRKEFVARCATGDWDAIVITHSAFEKIPVSADTEAAYLAQEIAQFRAAITTSQQGGGLSVKQLETAVLKKEERLKALRDDVRRDDGVTFEASGIDQLCVDEAHLFKNLSFPTRIPGVAGGQAKRATDLDLKLQYLRHTYGGRTAIFATATFVANSVAEMWVMQHYLQPDLLHAAGVEHFDAWAATFGRTVSTLELSPDGNSYRIKARFASFANVPELLAMFRAVADVKTADQLHLPAPALAGGRHHTVVVPASANLRIYTKSLADRAANLGRGAEAARIDNMLKITGDGRKAALDLRLVGLPPDPAGGKIAVAAERIAAIYHHTKNRAYPAAGTRPGALQLVFCDLSTPGPGWNAYQELKDRLVDQACPPTWSASSTTAPTTAKKPTCSPGPAPGPSPSWSGPPPKWASAPTSKPEPSPCTTSTPPGGPPTWTNETAASCAKATSTPRSPSSATSPKGPSTPSCTKPWNAKAGSSTRCAAATPTSPAPSTTSAKPPSPWPKSKPSAPATRSSWKKPASTATSPASNASPPATTPSSAEPPKSSPTEASASPASRAGSPSSRMPSPAAPPSPATTSPPPSTVSTSPNGAMPPPSSKSPSPPPVTTPARPSPSASWPDSTWPCVSTASAATPSSRSASPAYPSTPSESKPATFATSTPAGCSPGSPT